MTRWHMPSSRDVLRAVERAERRLAVQGYLVCFIALGAALAALCI